LPTGPGSNLLGYQVNSPIGVAAGPLLNSKWVEGYARLGFDVLTYSTVRSRFQPAHSLPNIRHVETRDQFAVAPRRPHANGSPTIAISTGTPSMDPDIWRKDMRRAKERLGPGQILIASILGTPDPGGNPESLIADYTRCAVWSAEAGADVIEVHLAAPSPFGEPGQMVYESIPLSAQILYRVRTTLSPAHHRQARRVPHPASAPRNGHQARPLDERLRAGAEHPPPRARRGRQRGLRGP
jgi:hypothetical protein